MRIRHVVAVAACALVTSASAIVLSASHASADPTPEEVEAEIVERHHDLEVVIEEYNAKREELKSAEELIEEIEDELPELEAAVEESLDAVADIAATAYSGSEFAYVNSILSGNADDLTDRLMYLQFISEAESAELAKYQDQALALEQRRAELEVLVEDADEILAEIDDHKAEIEAEIADLEELLKQVTPPPPPPPQTPTQRGGNQTVVDFAYSQLGKPYEYGSGGPNTWDCSGLVKGSWGAAGVSLPHNVAMQWDKVAKVSRSELAPGDIVFYSGLGHNALYIGNDQIIHAPRTGDVVKIASINIMSIQGYGRP